MQIITLDIPNYSLYCPVTGEPIFVTDKMISNDATSLMGYWVDMAFDDPLITDKALAEAWKSFIESSDTDEEDEVELLEKFLADYPGENKVVFKISNGPETHAMMSETTWFVLDLNRGK